MFIQVCGALQKTFPPLTKCRVFEPLPPNRIHLNIRKREPHKSFNILNIHGKLTLTGTLFNLYKLLNYYIVPVKITKFSVKLNTGLKVKVAWNTCDKELGSEMKPVYENYFKSSFEDF